MASIFSDGDNRIETPDSGPGGFNEGRAFGRQGSSLRRGGVGTTRFYRGGAPSEMFSAGRPTLDRIREDIERERRNRSREGTLPTFAQNPNASSGSVGGNGRDELGVGTVDTGPEATVENQPAIGSIEERRNRLDAGMERTRRGIAGDTSVMGQRNASPSVNFSGIVERMNAMQPRTVSPSLANLGFGLERQFGGQSAIDRQLNDRGLSLSQPLATTAGIMDDMAESLDLPEDEVFDMNLGEDYDAPEFVADFDMGDSEDTLDSAFTIA